MAAQYYPVYFEVTGELMHILKQIIKTTALQIVVVTVGIPLMEWWRKNLNHRYGGHIIAQEIEERSIWSAGLELTVEGNKSTDSWRRFLRSNVSQYSLILAELDVDVSLLR